MTIIGSGERVCSFSGAFCITVNEKHYLCRDRTNGFHMKNNLLDENSAYSGEHRLDPVINVCLYSADSLELHRDVNVDYIGNLKDFQGVSWIHVSGLSSAETVSAICSLYGVDPLAEQDILNVSHPSKIEEKDKYNVIITKVFIGDSEVQVSVVQGAAFVLTFSEVCNVRIFEDIIDGIQSNVFRIRGRQTDYLLTVILNGMLANHLAEINRIDSQMDDLESQLLSSENDKSLGIRIQSLRREYLRIKQTVMPLKEQYPKLLRSDSALIHKANRVFFNDVGDHILNVSQKIEICRETLASLLDLYIANNDLRMNDIMKRLTIVSTIFIPLTFLAGVWGMNFSNMPELEWRWGYPFAIGVMCIIGVSVFLLLRSRKWK